MIYFIAFALLCWSVYRLRFPSVHRYDYLECISFNEWKVGRDIKKEIDAAFQTEINYGTFYHNMRRLEDEGYIEHEDIVVDGEARKRRYRKIAGKGRPRKRKFALPKIKLPRPAMT